MSQKMRQLTKLYGIYDRADEEVPPSFPEALHRMFKLLGCNASLEWLQDGYGHEFFDDAAEKIAEYASTCLQPDFRRHMEAQASKILRDREARQSSQLRETANHAHFD